MARRAAGQQDEHSGAAVLLIDRRGRALLQQRDDDVPPAGYGRWTIPGGHREGSESARETALREFEEETGIRLQRLRRWGTATSGRYPGQLVPSLPLFFADDEVDEGTIVVNEGLDFRFWTPAESATLPMNPWSRALLLDFFASDLYRGTMLTKSPAANGVAVLALDRWGRVLLQLRDADLPPERHPDTWSLPGGLMEEGESPDATALREFEEETGVLLEELKLYRVFAPGEVALLPVQRQHVYYADPDLDAAVIEVNEGQAFEYFGPGDLAAIPMPAHARAIMELFFVSPAYKGLFH